MKLATGTKLICPQCGGCLCEKDDGKPTFARAGPTIKNFEAVHEESGLYTKFYAECLCGLCMFCQWAHNGWEYRVMV